MKSRGFTGVDLVISDNHAGPVAIVKKQLYNASWQRCHSYFSKDVLLKTPKKLQPGIKQCLRDLFTTSKIGFARSFREVMLETYIESAPKAMEVLEKGFDDVMAVMSLPFKYPKRLRTSNTLNN